MNFSQREIELLTAAVEATKGGQAIYGLPLEMANLETAGLVIGNPGIVDEATGSIAYSGTQNGELYLQNMAAAASVAPVAPVAGIDPAAAAATASTFATPAQQNGFAVGTGFQIPAKVIRSAGGKGTRQYPFESLEIGGYIFVPATEKRPDQKKSLASTISGANNRFKEFSPPRHFVTFRAVAGQRFGEVVAPSNGAYIVRVEPPVVDAAPVAANATA